MLDAGEPVAGPELEPDPDVAPASEPEPVVLSEPELAPVSAPDPDPESVPDPSGPAAAAASFGERLPDFEPLLSVE